MPKPSFFIDIDGVLYGGKAPVAKGPGVLNHLREHGLEFLLVTNTSRMSQTQIRDKLTALGYQIELNEIFPVSLAAVEYLSGRFGHACCFLIGDPSLETLLTDSGHSVVRHETPVDAVVMGQCMWPHFGEIDIARRLIDDGAEPIALHRDPTWPDGKITRIGLGSMVAALELVISQPVTLIGKPQRAFFDAALARTGFEHSRTVMIGDSLSSDIAGAINAGLKSLLVRTGNSISDPIPPGCAGELPSIADLPQWCDAQLDS